MPRSSSVPSLELLCRQETSIFLSHPNMVFTFPISALVNKLWSGYHGEEEPEARGAKSPEGAGSPRRQGSEESHRQEARCQGEEWSNLFMSGLVDAYMFFSLAKKCLHSQSRTRLRRRHRRQQRTSRRLAPAGLVARDKYFALKFL